MYYWRIDLQNTMKLFHTALLIFLLIAGSGIFHAGAQNLVIRTTDGIQTVRSLSSVRKVIFSDNNLLVNYFSGNSDAFPLISLSKMGFKQEITAISEPQSGKKAGIISVYPNPVDELLFVGYPEGSGKLTLFRIDGTPVWGETISSFPVQINVANLKPGLYLGRVNNQVFRFIKK